MSKTIETITAKIYWDTQDPQNNGWAWCATVNGDHDDSGPLDCDEDATEQDLIAELRGELTEAASAALSDDDVEIVR